MTADCSVTICVPYMKYLPYGRHFENCIVIGEASTPIFFFLVSKMDRILRLGSGGIPGVGQVSQFNGNCALCRLVLHVSYQHFVQNKYIFLLGWP